MDHPCSQCNAPVEDGVPFCPSCGKPQIRVVVPGMTESAPMPPGTPGEIQPPAEPINPLVDRTVTPRNPLGWPGDPAGDMREALAIRRNMIRAALLAGIPAGILCGFAQVVPLMMLLMLASGGLAITFFHYRMPGTVVSPSRGFRIGLLSGFFSWITSVCLSLLLMTRQAVRDLLQQQLKEKIAEALSNAKDQASREMVQRMGDSITTPSGLLVIFVIGMLFLGLLFLILGGIGGSIGAALFGRRPHND